MGDYLIHYGILGQKWGKRRYQNPDGTLTAEGKARYGSGTSPIAGANKPRRRVNEDIFKPGKDGKASPIEKGTRAVSDSVSTSRKLVEDVYRLKNRDKIEAEMNGMSDKELRDRINRMNLERQYSDLSAQTISVGEKKVADAMEIVGDLAAIGASAATIAMVINMAKKKGD